jgi:sortase A
MTLTSERPTTPRRALRTKVSRKASTGGAPRPAKAPVASRPPRASDDTASVISSTFTMVTLVCAWGLLQLLVLGGVSQARSQELLYGEFRVQLAAMTAPMETTDPGEPVALLRARSIGLDQVVVEGTASGDLLAGPGHRRDTVIPGQVGTSVLYGRAATYGAPFGDITSLKAGDELETVSAQGTTTWSVIGVRHEGDPLPQPLATGAARLTLVTAEGANGTTSPLAAGRTVYVDAEAAKGFPSPPRSAAAVPDSEKAMATDPRAWPLLALCLAALVALTLGVIAARQRWSTVLVWVVASPVAIALSWASTDVVMRLLPNLI